MNKHLIVLFLIFFSFKIHAQEAKQDSILPNKLDEVVITGQLSPQSVKKSVFEVKVISQKDIERQAGSNMSDLLTNELNLTITPDTGRGSSTVSLFGLDGQYFKILIDGVPIVSDTGIGNNVDLTQLSLENVKQVEIVEGSMAVTFGENAVTGIINIITKKSSKHKWEIVASLQEETVGEEYKLGNKGRHIQTFKVAHNINDNFYASLDLSRNEFDGFLENRKGKFFNETVENLTELNEVGRGYKWLPKEQLNIKTILKYKKNHFNIFYKLAVFNENLDQFSAIVVQNIHPQTTIPNPFSRDSIFENNRISHQINTNGKFKNGVLYNASASYQELTRDVETYQFFINQLQETNNETAEYLSLNAFHSKATFGNFIKGKKYNFQVGYELSNQKGFADASVSNIPGNNIKHSLTNYDFFTEAVYHPNEKLSFKPGIRYSFQSEFDNQFAASLSTKYDFGKGLTLRNIIGTAYRTPNFEELFTFFVDAQHNVRGNENLIPEKSYSFFTHLKKETWFGDAVKLTNKLTVTYLDVNDRIELVTVDFTVTPRRDLYINIDEYKYFGINLNNAINYKRFKAKLGLSYSGTSKVLDSETNANDDFLYALEVNSSLAYTIPKWNTNFNLSYKLTGKSPVFFQTINGFEEGERDSFSWLNASAQKKFYNNKITTTIGVRNLLNEKTIKTKLNGATVFDVDFAYGTSYYFKLAYNLNI